MVSFDKSTVKRLSLPTYPLMCCFFIAEIVAALTDLPADCKAVKSMKVSHVLIVITIITPVIKKTGLDVTDVQSYPQSQIFLWRQSFLSDYCAAAQRILATVEPVAIAAVWIPLE